MHQNSGMLNENRPVISFMDSDAANDGFSLFVTGHMVDAPERKNSRFPVDAVLDVRKTLRDSLNDIHQSRSIRRIICSGTAGVDLLALEWAVANNMYSDVYLPYDRQSFVEHAVGYGELSEFWSKKFEFVETSPKAKLYLPVTEQNGIPTREQVENLSKATGNAYQHYVDLNTAMIKRIKPDDLVVAYWDGKGGDSPGGTEHALKASIAQGAKYRILNYGIQNVAESYPYKTFQLVDKPAAS